MRFGSYFGSFAIHGLLLGVLFFWPTSPMIQLDRPMMQISINMGAPGGDRMPSAVLGPQGRPDPVRATAKPAPTTSAPESAAQLPAPPDMAPKEVVEAKAKPQPESKVEEKPAPRPEPKPEPKPADVPLVSEKKKPETKPEPKETPKETPKPAPKPSEAKPADSKKPNTSREDPLKAALADAQKKAGPATGARSQASSVSGALADLQKKANAQGAGGGGGGEGSGEGGGGIYDVYAGMVILAVRPNWSMPTYSRTVLVTMVRIRVDPQGNVLNCSIERSSGRPDFDASAVNAVIRTKVLPPPPTPEQQELILGFNSQEMGGGR